MSEVTSSVAVKHLLLRLPDGVQSRLAARAAREGRSVNVVATEILAAAAHAEGSDRRARLRARAAALGILRPASPVRPVSPAERQRIIASMKGIGPIADKLLGEEREVP